MSGFLRRIFRMLVVFSHGLLIEGVVHPQDPRERFFRAQDPRERGRKRSELKAMGQKVLSDLSCAGPLQPSRGGPSCDLSHGDHHATLQIAHVPPPTLVLSAGASSTSRGGQDGGSARPEVLVSAALSPGQHSMISSGGCWDNDPADLVVEKLPARGPDDDGARAPETPPGRTPDYKLPPGDSKVHLANQKPWTPGGILTAWTPWVSVDNAPGGRMALLGDQVGPQEARLQEPLTGVEQRGEETRRLCECHSDESPLGGEK